MTSETFVLLSGALTFGVPLYFAMRELRTLGPSGGGGRGPDVRDPAPMPPSPEQPKVETVQKPLPDCLIPNPMLFVPDDESSLAPAERELEPA